MSDYHAERTSIPKQSKGRSNGTKGFITFGFSTHIMKPPVGVSSLDFGLVSDSSEFIFFNSLFAH